MSHPEECKCAVCKKKRADRMRRYRAELKSRTPLEHGVNAYSNYGCRCDICSRAWSSLMRANRAARKIKGPPVHGSPRGVTDYGCSCEECVSIRKLMRRQNTAYGRNLNIHSSVPVGASRG